MASCVPRRYGTTNWPNSRNRRCSGCGATCSRCCGRPSCCRRAGTSCPPCCPSGSPPCSAPARRVTCGSSPPSRRRTGDRTVTPKTLPEQEEHLFAVLSGKRFLQMEGLSNEVPFFIYPYPPEDALAVAAARKRIKNRLANAGITVFEIDLYDLSVELLKERGVWDRGPCDRAGAGQGRLPRDAPGDARPAAAHRPGDPRPARAGQTSTSSSSPVSVRSSRTSARITC